MMVMVLSLLSCPISRLLREMTVRSIATQSIVNHDYSLVVLSFLLACFLVRMVLIR